ncbi:MAG: hypothetical protein J5483_00055, partial [Lachnospiraceae bacterium]|nr:hypothetical protein [Lachnospiraceae bacterium]
MKCLRTHISNKKKKGLVLLTAAILVMCVLLLSSAKTRADAVTDTLTVRVGYSGMNLNEYVVAGSYHWGELMGALPLYEQAYSYYQSGNNEKEYTAIVDAARGFYITDILNYAHIYYGDIYNFMFYVEDSQGIRSAFDTYSLFQPRYYFENLAGHRKILYAEKEVKVQTGEREITEVQTVQVFNEDGTPAVNTIPGEPLFDGDGNPLIDEETGEQKMGEPTTEFIYEEKEVVIGTEPIFETKIEKDYSKILGYDFSEAWNYCVQVQPMLAIEDNWASFNQEFENIGPDWTYANAGNRFRLLFGQTYPTETLTSKSDKYVSSMYVTLYGNPAIGPMKDGTMGSNTVELDVSEIYNEDMNSQLSRYLNIRSTDDSVVTVTGIETIQSGIYSDVSHVIVHYSVVGDGNASFIAGIGANDAGTDLSGSGKIVVKDGKATFVQEGAEPKQDAENKEQAPSSGNTDSAEAKDNGDPVGKNTEGLQEIDVIDNGKGLFLLSEDVQKLLRASDQLPNSNVEVVEVNVEDHTEETEKEERQILLYTGLGAVLLLAAGGVAELIGFKRRLKQKTRASES